MTGDRRRHPREHVEGLDGNPAGGRRQRQRDPADAHFRRLGEPAFGSCEPLAHTADAGPCRFEVYRADEVSTTSTRFAGGDWHWRLCNEGGRALIDAGGYPDERACREAVAILRQYAAHANVAPRP